MIRRSRTGLQLTNKYRAIVLGKKKGGDEITERLDRASWARPEPLTADGTSSFVIDFALGFGPRFLSPPPSRALPDRQ